MPKKKNMKKHLITRNGNCFLVCLILYHPSSTHTLSCWFSKVLAHNILFFLYSKSGKGYSIDRANREAKAQLGKGAGELKAWLSPGPNSSLMARLASEPALWWEKPPWHEKHPSSLSSSATICPQAWACVWHVQHRPARRGQSINGAISIITIFTLIAVISSWHPDHLLICNPSLCSESSIICSLHKRCYEVGNQSYFHYCSLFLMARMRIKIWDSKNRLTNEEESQSMGLSIFNDSP